MDAAEGGASLAARFGGAGSYWVEGGSSPPQRMAAGAFRAPEPYTEEQLACPREPAGSLSEAIYSPHTQTHRWSGVWRPARAGYAVALAGLVARHQSQLAARALTSSELQEHVTRVASGEGSSARALDLLGAHR